MTMKIMIVGTGRWGVNHVRTAVTLLSAENIVVVDANSTRLDEIKTMFPGIECKNTVDSALSDASINGAILATPAHTHYEIAKQIMERGIHLLVEKPITLNSPEAEELVAIAERKGVQLMVGHVLLYHEAIRTIKREIDAGKIGKLQYIYSNRLNLGAIRTEENSLWSFAPHDISIVQYFAGTYPTEVSAKGAAFVQSTIEDTTLTYLTYPQNVHAHIYVSWLHPFKEHRLVVIGSKGMFVFEDSLKENKLKFYPKGFLAVDGKIEKFEDTVEIMEFGNKQPLAEEQLHFYHCIKSNSKPLTDGRHAVEVLRILELAQKSIDKEK